MENMKNLGDFAKKYGVSTIMRRHFRYETPVGLEELVGGYPKRGAMTYTRVVQGNLLPLTVESCLKAHEQAKQLVAMGVTPTRLNCGTDQRNIDGARFSAAAIGGGMRWYQSPAWTYPYYADLAQASAEIERHGDAVVHRYLAGDETLEGLWVETRETFEARIVSSVLAKYPGSGPVLWDLNYEQMVVIYYRLFAELALDEIPHEGPGFWQPIYGCGLALSADRQMVVEFDEELGIDSARVRCRGI